MFAKKFFSVLIFLSLICSQSMLAQRCCSNIGFDSVSFVNWNGYTGMSPVTNWIPGFNQDLNAPVTDGSQHVLITLNGYDYNCSNDPCIMRMSPTSGDASVRLGNEQVNSHAEKLTYTMTIDSCNTGLLYSYAVVLEDPGHEPNEQPRFDVTVTDSAGHILGGTCGFYSVYAGSDSSFQQGLGLALYKCWTTVAIDLSAYIGQTIIISFATQDCTLGAHFGYAYVDARCISLVSEAAFCTGGNGNIILTAPPYFASYQWYTPDGLPISTSGGTSDTCFYNGPAAAGDTFTVALGSIPGCVTYMDVVLVEQNVQLTSTATDAPCPGSDGTISSIAQNGHPDFIYTYTNSLSGAIISSDTSTTGIVTSSLPAGSYIVSVKDTLGCRASNTLTIDEPPLDTLTAEAFFCMGDTAAVLYPPDVNMRPPYQLLSYPDGDILGELTNADSLLIGSPVLGQQYYYTWYDNSNCKRRSLLTLSHKSPDILFNPDSTANVFTPNGDGLNDRFRLYLDSHFNEGSIAYYAESFDIKIYSRWGRLVFQSDNYSDLWNGTENSKNSDEGVYYWIASYKNRCSPDTKSMIEQHGIVHLIR